MIQRLLRRQYSRLGEDLIIQSLLEPISHTNQFIVEIGAGDGVKMSNTYKFFKSGWPGAAFESDPDKFERLRRNYKSLTGVSTLLHEVTPDNIHSILTQSGVPTDFLLLNLDIDGCDYFVLHEILRAHRPIMIVTEINEVIPPPVKFKVLPQKDLSWKGGHFFGYSMACLKDLLGQFDYSLALLHYNNAVLMRSDHYSGSQVSIEEAYEKGYRLKRGRQRKFRYNRHLEHWHQMNPEQIVKEINRLFSKHAGNYEIGAL